uniref:Secreted protein n=1 Tax=Steinernema glaseri TaxID=37863 RepID=A0A1I7YD32_9BILA
MFSNRTFGAPCNFHWLPICRLPICRTTAQLNWLWAMPLAPVSSRNARTCGTKQNAKREHRNHERAKKPRKTKSAKKQQTAPARSLTALTSAEESSPFLLPRTWGLEPTSESKSSRCRLLTIPSLSCLCFNSNESIITEEGKAPFSTHRMG